MGGGITMFNLLSVFKVTLLCLIFSSSAIAQTVPRVDISGSVIDKKTGIPLYYANVFLSSTTLGAATDSSGHFIISRIPIGTYILVVSMMGYETSSIEIRLSGSSQSKFHFELTPKTLDTPTLEVTAESPREWKRDLKTFHPLFFGKTMNARQCEIVNPEVLSFNKEPDVGIFYASAEQPLEIENRALGYHVIFHLKDFRFTGELVHCKGLIEFSELEPENKNRKRKWARRRLQAYEGSPRHLYATLVAGRLRHEGFEIDNVYRLSRVEFGIPVSQDDILNDTDRPDEKKLRFRDYLRIRYQNEQVSWIQVDQSIPVTITSSGNISNAHAIKTYGHWAWERFAEELPADYTPPK